jgi:hypothetical protein
MIKVLKIGSRLYIGQNQDIHNFSMTSQQHVDKWTKCQTFFSSPKPQELFLDFLSFETSSVKNPTSVGRIEGR